MSFRKRSDIISGGANPAPNRGPVPSIPGRGPIPSIPGRTPVVPGRGPIIATRGPMVPGRGVPVGRDVTGGIAKTSDETEIDQEQEIVNKFKEILKPSSLNSSPTISTGIPDLDKLMGHQAGMPLGSSLLIEENGSTDFSGIILKSFGSQGIIHNRLDAQSPNTHLVVLTLNTNWAKELPGLYKGNSKQRKKMAIKENEDKLSVQNLINKPDKDLRIAWRYGINDAKKRELEKSAAEDDIYKNFNHQFDITTKLNPLVNPTEITYIPVTNFAKIYKQLLQVLEQQKDKIVRLIIPSFLNPAMYSPMLTTLTEVLPFIHKLKALTRTHTNLIIAATIPLDLYSKDSILVKTMESLFDSVIQLEPFKQDMLAFLEKAYKNEPTKVSHGLVHIFKLNSLSDNGQMLVTKNEYSFKNGRKKFEIEEWGIPVDDEADEGEKQTTKDIEF
ncbi:hypothetical protein WICPIJ_004146 [Wickerhamomyces pijperi]|uniref:Elongator complex protein 4 n=1 Tax=Wickerhamomyces pijperi TaxID=599730 RepID=A0A9P8Q8M9_WICPI|nr:hypothetical protein WICPIJ_004146 [Wickerhamomyces pijperi]